jgi:hypothetical protein
MAKLLGEGNEERGGWLKCVGVCVCVVVVVVMVVVSSKGGQSG